jgi:hypothetical protein
MFRAVLFLALLLGSVAAFGAGDFGNIKTGNVEAGGSIALNVYRGNSSFSMSPSIEYFVEDHLSVGGQLVLLSSSDYNSFGFGPSATYYFLIQDRWAPFVNANIIFSHNNLGSDHSTDYEVGVGSRYFITPSVTFGPSLIYDLNTNASGSTNGYLTLLGSFAIFL